MVEIFHNGRSLQTAEASLASDINPDALSPFLCSGGTTAAHQVGRRCPSRPLIFPALKRSSPGSQEAMDLSVRQDLMKLDAVVLKTRVVGSSRWPCP
jgi:hypothetical protein